MFAKKESREYYGWKKACKICEKVFIRKTKFERVCLKCWKEQQQYNSKNKREKNVKKKKKSLNK